MLRVLISKPSYEKNLTRQVRRVRVEVEDTIRRRLPFKEILSSRRQDCAEAINGKQLAMLFIVRSGTLAQQSCLTIRDHKTFHRPLRLGLHAFIFQNGTFHKWGGMLPSL